jgi:hypothetical protein
MIGMRQSWQLAALALVAVACASPEPRPEPEGGDGRVLTGPDPFADRVVSTVLGEGSGYGRDRLPDVVLGPPDGAGANAGSLDVLSLGREGTIVLEFTDLGVADGEGADLLVFENPFGGWVETGAVSVSDDGDTWYEWPCAAPAATTGCAGVNSVFASSNNGIDPTDPRVAGGDAFDLADLGIARARYVRIRDTGANTYVGTSGGFDLDAVAVVHGFDIAAGD